MKFINLTNGIEWICDFKDQNYFFIRIQSTTIECKNWIKLIQDLDHNLLMNLALGKLCEVYDCGTNRNISKTIYLGVPLINYILHRFWYGEIPKAYRYNRRNCIDKIYDVDDLYNHIYEELFLYNSTQAKVNLKVKLKYYKKFLNSKFTLEGFSKSTIHDGDYSFYKQEILKHEKIN